MKRGKPFHRPNILSFFMLFALMFGLAVCKKPAPTDFAAELRNSYRQDVNGWVFVHLEGEPGQVGFQHGYHLAAEIDDALRMFVSFLPKSAGKGWSFFRDAASRMFWPKVDPEYQEEIEGIVRGLKARLPNAPYDVYDITALNGWIELAWYYIPYFDAKTKAGEAATKAPSYCSAFIATGNYTEDGKIVMAHNAWVDYIVGERWNIIVDLVPTKGHRMVMDSYPGFIHSGDDFVMNSDGILYTETTMSMYSGFDESGTPEFVRARRAAQYASSIDDFVHIMKTGNNGAYANDWLIGDVKTNEIARLELGLKNQRIWRTTDGYFVGANFPCDEKVIAEETTYKPEDSTLTVNVRKARWEQLMEEFKGRINAETGKLFEADHLDASTGAVVLNSQVLCGHVDEDPRGLPEFIWPAYYPAGSVQGKVTTAALASELKLWARMGHPCGRDFLVAEFLAKHPEFSWQAPFLKDMKSHPWTLFEAKK